MSYGHGGKRAAPFSLRLSFEERTKVEANAGSMPVAAFTGSLLFADNSPDHQSRSCTPVHRSSDWSARKPARGLRNPAATQKHLDAAPSMGIDLRQ